ncbi:HEAT repeat domain-containing protein [Paenibacillus sp.]|uniref:HEAT repeat domain-containing protein n=1 Tax=Paenibacillus sp. TaxID=58172 RepID=UPI00281164A6|nr:HEAT repeat domain-containing protein [Paenibacillus sp.]
MSQDMSGVGRRHLQNDSYGVAAFCMYRAIQEQPANPGAWNGLVLALSLMRREHDTQTILARYALQPQLPYDKQMVPIAFMMFRNSPPAMVGWTRAIANRPGVSPQERQSFEAMASDIEESYRKMAEERGEDVLKSQGMLTLEEFAARVIELDLALKGAADALFAQAEEWLKDESTVLSAVRMLCLLPDPRSERLLRRVCRDEGIPGKMRTHALLALRWLGVRGNVRLQKMGESFVVDLNAPKPELTISVPASYKPALDRMLLWMAKELGAVTAEEYERFAASEEKEMPEALAAKVKAADLPGILQEVVHTVIRSAYDEYYPLVPAVKEYRSWSNAFLIIMKEYVEGSGGSWSYGPLEQDDTAVLHRNWLLSATPDFHEQISAARKNG